MLNWKKNKPIHFIYRDCCDNPLTEVRVSADRSSVLIKNYTGNLLWKCFGNNENPTWDDVLKFFEDRCFDLHCGDADEKLRACGLTEYDPYLICRQNEGRCESDYNWIEFL